MNSRNAETGMPRGAWNSSNRLLHKWPVLTLPYGCAESTRRSRTSDERSIGWKSSDAPMTPAGSPPRPGCIAFCVGRLAEGRSWLDRALALPGGSEVVRARTVGVTGFLAANQGDYSYQSPVERQGLEESRRLGDRAGEAIALFALGDMACEQNDYDRARELLHAAVELCDNVGDNVRATMALFDLGSLSRRLGHEEEAETVLAGALVRARAQGFGLAQAFGLNMMSRIKRAQGEIEEARAMYRESLELAWTLGHRLSIAFILLDGATVAAEAGQTERATRLLGAAEALREAIGLPREPSLAHATGVGYTTILTQLRTELGADRFERAWEAGRALPLEAAVAEAMWEDEIAPASDADRERVVFGLTARELDVLCLLVAGLTDRQIGETLFISPRTAQAHVANILAKLDVPTRGAAAATALRHGLFMESTDSETNLPSSDAGPLRT